MSYILYADNGKGFVIKKAKSNDPRELQRKAQRYSGKTYIVSENDPRLVNHMRLHRNP